MQSTQSDTYYPVATRTVEGDIAVFRVREARSYIDAISQVACAMHEEGVKTPVVLSLVAPISVEA